LVDVLDRRVGGALGHVHDVPANDSALGIFTAFKNDLFHAQDVHIHFRIYTVLTNEGEIQHYYNLYIQK
jgi:hypothetical protein